MYKIKIEQTIQIAGEDQSRYPKTEEIYIQLVDDIDLKAIINAVNAKK